MGALRDGQSSVEAPSYAVQYAGGGKVAVTTTAAADPVSGQVRLRVAYVGLCGTDLHIVHGDMDARVTTPLTFGHEMSGTIEAVGADVVGWAVGDTVTVMPLRWDGTCPGCLAGHRHICQNLDFVGIDSPGALQQLWTVSADLLVRIPADTSLRAAALIEPVAVAAHDVRRGEVKRGDAVVVIGGGPIGVLIALVARQEGARVVLAEPDESRRAHAAALGFDTLDPRGEDMVARVNDWTEGAGADVVFEVSGAASAVITATSLVKVRGTLVVVAIHSVPREVDLHRVFLRELRIVGARVYERADFDRAVELVSSGAILEESILTGVVPLEDTQQALSELQAGRAMKLLVDVQSTSEDDHD